MEEINVHGRKIKILSQAVDEEQWTDGRFLEIIDGLIAERQRLFEEAVAAHLAKTHGNAPKPDPDATTESDVEPQCEEA